MSKLQLIKKSLSNPAILYVISRYGTYIIQFINSLFIAVYLGPYYLGIWGFIGLITGYVAQINLGIPNSTNVILSINKNKGQYANYIVNGGLAMSLILSILISIFFFLVKIGIIEVGVKYNFSKYIFIILGISVLTHMNTYFSTIMRVYGKINAITITQFLYPILLISIVPFFRNEDLLWAMLYVNLFTLIISFLVYLIDSPFKIKPLFNWRIFKTIQIKGWYLFIYNASFYLILLTTNTFISYNFTVKEFGYYTFAYSLANAVLLLLNSISFLIYPKMINSFARHSNAGGQSLLQELRVGYISTSHLLIHFVIMIFPLFLLFFPSYSNSSKVFKIIALTIVLYCNSFGYQGYLMAKGEEKKIALIAFLALSLNIVLLQLLIHYFHVQFEFVILATLSTYFVYVYLLAVGGRKLFNLPIDFFSILEEVFPYKMMIPFILSLIFVFNDSPDLFFTLPFVLYCLLNYKDFFMIKRLILKVILNPSFINI